MTRRPLSAALIALVIASAAATARAETSLSVYTGTSDTASADLRIRVPSSGSDATFHGVSWQTRPFEDSPYYGIRLTYFHSDSSRMGASLDFTHYKIYAEPGRSLYVTGKWNGAALNETAPMNLRVQGFEASHGLNLAALDVIYRWPIGRGAVLPQARWQTYVGVGLAAYVPHPEAVVNGSFTSGGYQLGGFGYQILAGLEYRLSRYVSLFAELKNDGGEVDMDLQGGTHAETRVRTFHAIAGVTVSLGR